MKAKKIVSLLLAAAMTVSMAACGGSAIRQVHQRTTATMQRGMLQTKMQRRVEYPRKLPKMKRKISQISFRKRQLLSMYSIS